MRTVLAATLWTLIAVCVSGCGESREDKAARGALAATAQKHIAECRDITAWAEGTAKRSDTWQDSFDRHEAAIKQEEEIAIELRGVILTKRYMRLGNVLNSSVATQTEYLRARRSALNHYLSATTAMNRAMAYSQQAQASGYSNPSYYVRSIDRALADQKEAYRQARLATTAANHAGAKGVVLLDTLRALVVQLELLPDPGEPKVVLQGRGGDSLVIGSHEVIQLTHR